MTNLFEIVLVLFFSGALSFWYGEKVNNELVSTILGVYTLIIVMLMAGISVYLAVNL